MKIKVIGSNSHGNCYILETSTSKLILECGVKFKEIQKALSFNLSNVAGCLITHEHSDHSKAVKDAMKSGLDVYLTHGTASALDVFSHRVNIVKALQQIKIGEFTVLPFQTQHDTDEPVGYLIQCGGGKKILFATDTYYISNRFTLLDCIMIECNYTKESLDQNVESGRISHSMKSRLLKSHFSLENVKKFLMANDLSKCKKIVLLHLSYHNSDAVKMVKEITELTGIETVVADAGIEIEFVR